jgi:putative membrane protein
MLSILFQSGADGTWASDPWHELWRWLGPSLFGALVVGLIVKALLRRKLYLAVDVLHKPDLDAVHDALRAAEKRTIGEIVPVVFERADAYPEARWRAGAAFTFFAALLLAAWLPWHAPHWLLACLSASALLGGLLAAWLPDVARTFVTSARVTEMAEEQAFQEFFRHGLHKTAEQTGVLLFVCLFERRVIVFGDAGIDAKVGAPAWADARDALLKGIRAGSLRDGLIASIRQLGDVLAQHFPWREGDRNEIPDRLVVQRR